jgi:cytochrome P450
MTTESAAAPRFDTAQPEFWRRPLQQRMDDFAAMRAQGPFWDSEIPDTMGMLDGPVPFHAVTTYDEVVEISRKPKQFCSGQGAVAIPDMPAEALEFWSTWSRPCPPRSPCS